MAKKKYYVRPDKLHESIRTINGKRVAFRGKSDREVDRKILEYKEDTKKGRPFKVVADEWERDIESSVRASTRKTYKGPVKRMKAWWGDTRMSKITPSDVAKYMRQFEAKGYANNTVACELSVCRRIFASAVLQGDIPVNPAAEVRKSKGLIKRHRRAMTEEEETLAEEAIAEKRGDWWLLGAILLYTGMRRGEAMALNFEDIDTKNNVIHVTKKVSYVCGSRPQLDNFLKSKNGRRDIPLLPPLASVLPKDHIGLIFHRKDGGYLTMDDVRKAWSIFCQDAGIDPSATTAEDPDALPLTPHCCRHSFATLCYEVGLDPRQAAGIIGDTTDVLDHVYTHLRGQHKQTAADKLNQYFANKKASEG